MQHLQERVRASIAARSAAAIVVAMTACTAPGADAGQSDRRRQGRVDEALRREGDALVAMADAAAAGRLVPSDFTLAWRNDFFKAQPGTFVPFTITFDASRLASGRALMYVRAQRTAAPRADQRGKIRTPYAYETIFPLSIEPAGPQPVSVQRGFAVPPGRYTVTVALRETSADGSLALREAPKRAVLSRELDVPDFWTTELTTSTVMLAERLEPVVQPVATAELDENPYVVGSHRIHLASGSVFRQNSELIVVFLVYNPSVAPDKHFDLQVDYHLYRKDREGSGSPEVAGGPPVRVGERYVTRTNPQRFNPSLMGGQFDPSAGAPVLAGQGILLSGFEPGEYRLGITVTDLLSRKSLSRDVAFRVIGS